MIDETQTPRCTGRPRLAPGERRAERLPDIRVTISERASVEAKAAQAGIPVTEFCRRAILGARITTPAAARSGIPSGLLADLARVGNNLNQIAHAAHLGRDLPGMAHATLIDLRALMDSIAARLDDES